MNAKIVCFCLLVSLIISKASLSQTSFISAREWPMPSSHTTGLTMPAFKLVPNFSFVSYGDEKQLVLKMDVIFGTALKPNPSFAYRYTYKNKEYTDRDLGTTAFQSISLNLARFKVRIQGPGINTEVIYDTNIGHKTLGKVPSGSKLSSYDAHIMELTDISYRGTDDIHRAIGSLQATFVKKSEGEQGKLADGMPLVNDKTSNSVVEQNSGNTLSNSPTEQKPTEDDFWNDKSQEVTKVVPDQPVHKDLPDFVRTTDGGYFHRGPDGKFREVSAAEYQEAKKQAAASKAVNNNGSASSQKQEITAAEEVTINQMVATFKQDMADNQALFDDIDRTVEQKAQAWQQNYYYAEAIRTGKENLDELSGLSGDYKSVSQLEADFNRKYNSIQSQVSNLEQARNARLSNAVTSTFNGNSTEQAIGAGMQLVGNMLNGAKAAKEAKEAQTALKLARERQLAAIAAAKKKAMIEIRTKLTQSFPEGGTPLSSHKVNLPQVFMFTYITDKAAFNNESATIAVSNVFPVKQYTDGTYPYKTTVLRKVKGYAPGAVTLVGYYTDKDKAEQMRNTFVGLAAKSKLTVRPFTIKVPGSTSSGSVSGDFWETGNEVPPVPIEKKEAEKPDFWDN